MKKIFFLLGSMNVGGVEKAFLSMLPYIPTDKYEIHLGLLNMRGGFLDDIPSYVIIHHVTCYSKYKEIINNPPLQVIFHTLKRGHIINAIIQTFLYIHFKLTQNRYLLYKYLLRKEPTFPIIFDLAIAYAGPFQAIDYYVTKKVKAQKKCGWIHFDIEKFGIDKGMTDILYPEYDKIFIVSQTAKNKFDKIFPKLKNKTEVFYNIVSPEQIHQFANVAPTFKDSFTGKRILTVGRITSEKGHDIAIKALKILIDKGYNVKWYFVGDGKNRQNCELLSRKLKIENHVVFLGVEKNPYGYMRDCDIYVQPSRHEGYCITLAEARIFTSPIVATNFVGAKEQLANRANGIVIGFSEEDIATGIIQALTMNRDMTVLQMQSTDIDKLLALLDGHNSNNYNSRI